MSEDNKSSVEETETTTPMEEVVEATDTVETTAQVEATESNEVATESTPEMASDEELEENPLVGETETVLAHVFSGEVEGEVFTLDQLEKPSDEYSEDEYNQLMGMYENTLNEIEEKEIVTGRIISIDDKYVVIDIGFKSEGIVAVNEFNNKQLESMAPGDEVDVFLDRVEDKDGQLILSRRKADILQAWEKLEDSHSS